MDVNVYESKRSVAWLFAAGAIFLGILMVRFPGRPGPDAIWRTLGGLFVGLWGSGYFALEALRPRRLRVTTEALLFEKGGKLIRALPWREVDSFSTVRRRSISMLGYKLRKGAPKGVGDHFTHFFEGVDGVLYGFWPKSAKEMAAMLNVYLGSLRDLDSAAPSPAPIIQTAAPQVSGQPTVTEPSRLIGRRRSPPPNKPIVW